ncbi:hypothetical protein PAI11_20880 [Patulibacter medicamentivorans]|uniref:Uncharacterized protein n=1 Tax=Patulibacter medicamentivorans TaxID=1097667 RepID=H0E5J7_9ACTN|nr:hypothetical protein PAI11_20880 [Patulibacter medicamentivorans]
MSRPPLRRPGRPVAPAAAPHHHVAGHAPAAPRPIPSTAS